MSIINKFHNCLLSVWRHYRHHALYVIADPIDNSITLSKRLFRQMKIMQQSQAKVFIFSIKEKESKIIYAFTLNPPEFLHDTQLADIQYNSKHRTIGFESLCPTVNRILYDYGLTSDRKVKLTVEPQQINIKTDNNSQEVNIYKILCPCQCSR